MEVHKDLYICKLYIIIKLLSKPHIEELEAFELSCDCQLCFILHNRHNKTLQCGSTDRHVQQVFWRDPLTINLSYYGQWQCLFIPTPNRPTPPLSMGLTVAGTLHKPAWSCLVFRLGHSEESVIHGFRSNQFCVQLEVYCTMSVVTKDWLIRIVPPLYVK